MRGDRETKCLADGDLPVRTFAVWVAQEVWEPLARVRLQVRVTVSPRSRHRPSSAVVSRPNWGGAGHQARRRQPLAIGSVMPTADSTPNYSATAFLNDRWQVLLIDDCPLNCAAANLWLTRLGCDVHACADAERGLEALQTRTFDLAIFDCGLPRMDGWTAARLWREQEARTGRQRLPIIAWTASDLPDLRERCLAAGMDDVLGKPTSGVCFADIVAEYLAKSEAQSALQQGAPQAA